VTRASATAVTAPEGPSVRSEPFVHGLAAHAEGVADLVPGEASSVGLDDEPGDDVLQLAGGVIGLPGGHEEVLRTEERASEARHRGSLRWMDQRGEPRLPAPSTRILADSYVAFPHAKAPIPTEALP